MTEDVFQTQEAFASGRRLPFPAGCFQHPDQAAGLEKRTRQRGQRVSEKDSGQ